MTHADCACPAGILPRRSRISWPAHAVPPVVPAREVASRPAQDGRPQPPLEQRNGFAAEDARHGVRRHERHGAHSHGVPKTGGAGPRGRNARGAVQEATAALLAPSFPLSSMVLRLPPALSLPLHSSSGVFFIRFGRRRARDRAPHASIDAARDDGDGRSALPAMAQRVLPEAPRRSVQVVLVVPAAPCRAVDRKRMISNE